MHQNSQAAPLYQEVRRASWIGLATNLSLGIVKLIGGLIGSSFALIADAVNSLGDSVTAVIVLYSLKVAESPADKEHPYGHTRAEGIAALTVSVLIIVSALWVGWEALIQFQGKKSVPPIWTLWIAGTNVLIKEGLYRYKMAVGKRTGSMSIVANAWDHRSDALCALAVVIGLAAIRLGGSSWAWADKLAALVVVVVIVWAGARLFRQSASELMDVQADEGLVTEIRKMAADTPGVREVDKLWVRKSGLEFFIDIHIQVDPGMTVDSGHRIGHQVKAKLLKGFPAIRDVLVHLEPHTSAREDHQDGG
jgi:cation diffusion facilitator family transporter